MKILDIQTALPEFALTQEEAWEFLQVGRELSRQEAVLYRRFMTDPGIQTRHFAIDKVADCFTDNQDELVHRFERMASQLSAQAVQTCLEKNEWSKDHVTRLVTATCTGYVCPGISSHVIERLALSADTFATDLVGMGCGGALPVLRTLMHRPASTNGEIGVGVCTEICSAAISWGDDPELILSNSIFGDGSAAMVIGNGDRPGWQVKGFCFKTIPALREKLRFITQDSKLRNVLTPDVPETAAEYLDRVAAELLAQTHQQRGDIRFWALHAGGRKVIDAITERLQLTDEQVSYTRSVLRDCGNMSSPTVLFVLKRLWEQGDPQRGDKVLMASFGAGFTMYAALLEYC